MFLPWEASFGLLRAVVVGNKNFSGAFGDVTLSDLAVVGGEGVALTLAQTTWWWSVCVRCGVRWTPSAEKARRGCGVGVIVMLEDDEKKVLRRTLP